MFLLHTSILLIFHAIYISVTQVEINDETNKMEISVKVFTNDLEDGIYNLSKQSISLRTNEQLQTNSSLIDQYLNQKIKLQINGQIVRLMWVKSENEGDATWNYFEVDINSKVDRIEIENNILTELFETQSNVVSVDVYGDKRFLRFSKDSKSELLEF